MKTTIKPIYSRQADLSERYGICRNTVRARTQEIKEEVGKGKRYSDGDVIVDGNIVLVNEWVFLDWLNVRTRWLNPETQKHIEPFDPAWWARRTGADQIRYINTNGEVLP